MERAAFQRWSVGFVVFYPALMFCDLWLCPAAVLASPPSRRKQNIPVAKSDHGPRGGPHGYTKPDLSFRRQQVSAVISATTRGAAKRRRSRRCLQCPAAWTPTVWPPQIWGWLHVISTWVRRCLHSLLQAKQPRLYFSLNGLGVTRDLTR